MKQATRHELRWVALVLPLLLGACASGRDTGPALAAAYAGDVNQLLVTAESNDQLTVKGVGRVSIGRSYLAASGRTCRRLNRLDGTPLPLRSCQNESGQWYTTRSISASGAMEMSAAEMSVESRGESVGMELKQGESLWAFASRVTGNPLNWKRIASDNELSDADNVWPGQLLQVEHSLLKDAP
ncbi:LysM peptidoglycan-binding domain-containing protein [Granulosicoccus sp. 3-233]|uniref:LysM peptidoglycan-binding domain-containing protein n=1 Tax=Granulosicoccus sp. 3-233 TaxID=3417969 RepID=UPI003D3534C1